MSVYIIKYPHLIHTIHPSHHKTKRYGAKAFHTCTSQLHHATPHFFTHHPKLYPCHTDSHCMTNHQLATHYYCTTYNHIPFSQTSPYNYNAHAHKHYTTSTVLYHCPRTSYTTEETLQHAARYIMTPMH